MIHAIIQTERCAALILAALLTGCATPEYWRAGMFTPVPGQANIIYTSEMPQWYCAGEGVEGCWIIGTAFVYVLDTLLPAREKCVIDHEVDMHKGRGFGHEPGAMPYDVCGYATLRKLGEG